MHCDHPGSNFDCLISGTTATLSCIRNGKLYSAHVGDSRGVIAKRNGNKLRAFRLTRDHKP